MDVFKDSSGALVFKGQMIASEVEALHAKLEPLLDDVLPEVNLDLSNVDDIDISGIQLLYSIRKCVEREGFFRIRSVSSPVQECISLSGFEIILKEVT